MSLSRGEIEMLKRGAENIELMIVILLLMAVIGGVSRCAKQPLPEPKYKRLTMQMPDGKLRVFIGVSARSIRGEADWRTRDGVLHTFVGPHWLEDVSSQTFRDFRPPAEEIR